MSNVRTLGVVLLAAAGMSTSFAATAASATGKVKVTVRGPKALSVNAAVRSGKTRFVVSKSVGQKSAKSTLPIKPGRVTLTASRVIFDGSIYEPKQRTVRGTVRKGRTAALSISYRELPTAKRLSASAVTQTSVSLAWLAPKRGAVQLRRAEGELAPSSTKQGTLVPSQGAGATDLNLRPGTRYTYGLFTKVKGKWVGPLTVAAVTASSDPQAAAYVAPPSTIIVRPGDQDAVTTDGQRVTVQLAAGRSTPPLGAGFVLPVSAALPGGFVGRVVAVSPDGRTVTLETGGIADAFDYYELSSDLSSLGPIPLERAPTASGARAKRLALPLCLGGSLQNTINFKPILKPKGHFKSSVVKRLGFPVGAQFDMSIAFEVGLAIDAEFKAALECGLPLKKVTIPIAATPVPIVLVIDPSIKVTASVAGKVEDFGYTVTAGFWAKGGLGVGGHGLQVGRIREGGPTAINQTAELQLGAEMGGEVTLGPGLGSPVAGVVAGVGGAFTLLKATAGPVFAINDPRRGACLRAGVSGELSANLNAKAWLGNWSVSRVYTLDALKGEFDYGGPWYFPRDCENLPEPKPEPEPQTGMTRAEVTWDNSADVDLHVWDPAGNHAWYRDLGAIPNARLVEDVIPGFGPERFETFVGTGDRYTYGICHFDDNGEDATTIAVDLVDPSGAKQRFERRLVYDKDAWLVGVSPGGQGFVPEPGWCDRTANSTDPMMIGGST